MTLREWLDQHDACDEGSDWATDLQPAEAWATSKRPGWMLWALDALGYEDERVLREYACWCARQAWHLLTDERSRAAVEVAERYARGEATGNELAAARAAAWAAAHAADDAAADAAAWAAHAADDAAADAAAWAAHAAAWAAHADAAWAAAHAAAWAADAAAARATQADRLREVVPLETVLALWERETA